LSHFAALRPRIDVKIPSPAIVPAALVMGSGRIIRPIATGIPIASSVVMPFGLDDGFFIL
jgi:hypothetical protein